MSAVNLDFRNMVGSKKCAIPSPEIVSLEIGDESPGNTNDSALSTFFRSGHGSENGITNHDCNPSGCENRTDKDFLIHPQLALSTCSRDNSYSNQESRVGDCNVDNDLLELLNSTKSTKTVEPSSRKFHGNNISSCANDEMKTWNNLKASGDDSDLLSSLLLPDTVSVKNGCFKLPSFCCDTKTDIGDFDILPTNTVGNNPSKSNNKDIKLSRDISSSLSDLLSSINIQNSNKDAFTKSKLNDEPCANTSEFNVEGSLSDLLSSIAIENIDTGELPTPLCSDEFRTTSANDLGFKIKGSLSDMLLSVNIENSICNKPYCIDEQNLKSSTCKAEDSFFDLLSPDPNEKKSAKSKHVTQLSNNSASTGESGLSDLLLSANDVNKFVTFHPSDSSGEMPTCKLDDCVSDWLSIVNIENSNELPSTALTKSIPSTAGGNSSLRKKSDSPDLDTDSTSETTYGSTDDSCASSLSDAENNSLQGSLTKNGVYTDSDDSGFNSFASQKREFSFFSSSPEDLFPFNLSLSKRPDKSKDENKRDGIADKEINMLDLTSTINLKLKNPISESSCARKICALDPCDDTDEGCVSMVDLVNSIDLYSQGSLSENFSNQPTDLAPNDFHAMFMTNSSETIIPIPKEATPHNKNEFFDNEDKSVWDTEEQYIDLSSCLKSTESKLSSAQPPEEPKNSVFQASLGPVKNYILDEKLPLYIPQNHLNPFECRDTDLSKKSRVNAKQSLFSKALACKPRKNPSLAKKVASIKCELFENIVNRPECIDCDVPPPKTEVVSFSDRCILPFEGRKYFGIAAPSEPQ